ncbi:MAG: hypothetical protein FGM44_14120, partial [Limnohabitans sp.]|nr:hypothetical protein [Limnohabitans sp.]
MLLARALLASCLLWGASGVWAQSELRTTGERVDHETVQQLMRQARHAQALVDAERFLAEHPRDPQM